MKLTCKSAIVAHWGAQFLPDKEYEVMGTELKEVRFLSDNDRYWELNSLVLKDSEKWRKFLISKTDAQLDTDYIKEKEINWRKNQEVYLSEQRKLEVKLKLPFLIIKSEDRGVNYEFLISTNEEIFQYVDQNGKPIVDKKPNGEPAFSPLTIHRIDDFFDYKQIRRDKKLEELLK